MANRLHTCCIGGAHGQLSYLSAFQVSNYHTIIVSNDVNLKAYELNPTQRKNLVWAGFVGGANLALTKWSRKVTRLLVWKDNYCCFVEIRIQGANNYKIAV